MRSTAFYDGFFQGCLIAAVAASLVIRIYHVAYHPEWTEAQLFLKFLPVWAIIFAIVVFAFLWSYLAPGPPPRG